MSDQGKVIRRTTAAWDEHYGRDRARQSYPDENLVRIVKQIEPGAALDYGCGSGRHVALLLNEGFSPVYGTDISETALQLCESTYPDARFFPIKDGSVSLPDHSLRLVLLWGVLHYNSDDGIDAILNESIRLLAPDGVLAGTLRAVGDTHFADNSDINDAFIRYFTQEEALNLLSSRFEDVKLGYSERSPIGELSRRICHWTFLCRR